MDWMYANCSTTAQRGALDWKKKFRNAVAPVFRELYTRVKQGKETEIVLKANSAPDYREKLDKELAEMRNSEMWRAGAAVRGLRPENRKSREREQHVKQYKIGVIPGMEPAGSCSGRDQGGEGRIEKMRREVRFKEFPLGGDQYLKKGTLLPDEVIQELKHGRHLPRGDRPP